MLFWKNGKFIDDTNLKVNILDHGLLYGLNFSESFRTYSGQVVLFNEHYNQLCQLLTKYRIKMPYSTTELQEAISELVNRDNGTDGIIRLIVLAGNNKRQVHTTYEKPTILLTKEPLSPLSRGIEKQATWLKTPFSIHESGDPFVSPYYRKDVLGRFEIESLDNCEGFFLTENGLVADSITSSIFWVKDDIIYTPSLSIGLSPSITRQWVIVKATQMGYKVIEGLFFKQEVESKYECFTVNPIDELVPISKIGKVKFLGNDGPVYQILHQAYIEEIIQTIKGRAK